MSVDSPARPAIPDPAAPQAGQAEDRRRRKGPALALRNWPLPWRLIALIAIPTVVAMAFAGLRVAAAASSAATFGRSAQLAVLGQQVTGLAQAMEDERDLTASFIASGRPASGRQALLKQYAVTDAWARRVRAQARGVGSAFPAPTRADAAAVIARIADLPHLRSYALAGDAPALAATINYTLATADLFALNDDIAQQTSSPALVGRVRALGSLSRMKDQASLQRAILEAALATAQFEPGALNALITAQAQQATDLASFETSATLGETQALSNTVAGPPVNLAQALEQRAIVLGSNGGALRLGPGASRDWYTDMSYTVGKMRQAERQLASSIALQAKALHQGAVRSLMLTGAAAIAVLIFVLLATVVIARSMVRPLRRLKAGALEVAEVRLPEEVRELSTSKGSDRAVDVEPIGVHSTDEIGQVARAFDEVHQEAVRLAADEARLRGSVSAMFVSLSRRSQSLLERLLRLIDSLELGEQDSERLADLFRMDHLATRMRRNSENLLVLAGQDPPRRWAEPVSLADVARASSSEIEQYDRVVLDIQPGLGVTGNAVADIVHLLAEVLENATTFSAKSTQVTVSGHALRSGGVLINVIDSGMGMTDEHLEQVNWRLENPPAADVEVARHMGLFAVAHLAARHGIRVRLRKVSSGGLIAHLWLPDALISQDSRPAPWDRIRTARASAVVQAVTRTARFPQDPAAAAPQSESAAAPQSESAAAPQSESAAAPQSESAAAPQSESAAAPQSELAAAPQSEFAAAPQSEFAAAPLAEAPLAEETTAEETTAEETMAETAVAATPLAEETMAEAMAEAAPVVVPDHSQPAPGARLPVFESVESDWFRARRRPSRPATAKISPRRAAQAWTSPSDDGWRAAEAALEPAVGGVTTVGLPRRTPQANLVPGSAGDRQARPARPASADSAEAMSSRLAGFQRGSRRARAAASGAQPPAEES